MITSSFFEIISYLSSNLFVLSTLCFFLLNLRLNPLASLLSFANGEPSFGFSAASKILEPKSIILIGLPFVSSSITDHPTDVIPISNPTL